MNKNAVYVKEKVIMMVMIWCHIIFLVLCV